MRYFRTVKRNHSGWILGLLIGLIMGLPSKTNAQRFQLEHEDYSDSVIWYVRNTGPTWVKPTSITINWFHTKPDLFIWDANPGPASYRNRITEINKSGNLTFKYKSTQGVGLNDTLYPGKRVPVFYSVNYNTLKTDTVMPANAILFYHDSLVRDGEEEVIPKGASCSYERIYLNSLNANSGIHYRSTVWYNLHRDMCQKFYTPDLFVMVIFDQKTFKPTSAGVMPKCASGRYGTAFGYPKDSQIYYSFTLSDGPHIDSVINGITDGDYVALVSYPTFSQYSISKMKSRFAPIGLNTDSLIVGPYGIPDVQMVFWGRKGLSTSKGRLNTMGRFFKPPGGSIVSLTADHLMITNQPSDELSPWPPCFETLAVVHQPYIPAPPQIGIKSIVSSTLIAAMPNPANEHITLHTKEVVEWEFYDAYGRQVPQRSNSETIEITGWAAGLYYGIGKPSQPGKSVMYRTQFIKTR